MDELATPSRARLQLLPQLLVVAALGFQLALELFDLLGELDDRLDAGEVDPFFLREVLDAAQHGDVAAGVAAPAALGAHRRDQAKPVVGAQGLRVHAGELGGNGDDVILLVFSH